MRRLLFGTLATATLLVLGGAAYAWQAANYANVAGPITGNMTSGITGTFHLEAASPPDGIMSNGWGGACITFRAKDLGYKKMAKKRCMADDDCTTQEAPGEDERHGYCHQRTKKCWAKAHAPSIAQADQWLCTRRIEGVSPLPLQPGEVVSIAVTPSSLRAMQVNKNSKARVLTCLNGVPGGGCRNAPGAAAPDYDWGDPEPL